MFDYLKPHDGPVVVGLESHEVVYAKEQPEYNPLRVLRSKDGMGRVLSRWALTDEQREAVAAGADIYLELVTFNQPLQPIRVAIQQVPCPMEEPVVEIAVDYNLAEPDVQSEKEAAVDLADAVAEMKAKAAEAERREKTIQDFTNPWGNEIPPSKQH